VSASARFIFSTVADRFASILNFIREAEKEGAAPAGH